MAFAQIDLRQGIDPAHFLDSVGSAASIDPHRARLTDEPLYAWLREVGGAPRVGLLAGYGNVWLAEAVAEAARTTGHMDRAILGLDHDEYGIEHIILSGRGGAICRVQHVYVEPCPDCEPSLADIPPCPGVEVGTGDRRPWWRLRRPRERRIIDGPGAWTAVAALYDVPAERIAAAAWKARKAHQELGVVFTPFAPWWDAVGAVYPDELGPHDVTLLDEDED